MDRIKKEPAVVIGILASAVLAVITSLAGNGVISSDVAASIGNALDPSQGGWAIPILVGIVTRFFVSPASEPGL
jgi:hypothetical protein